MNGELITEGEWAGWTRWPNRHCFGGFAYTIYSDAGDGAAFPMSEGCRYQASPKYTGAAHQGHCDSEEEARKTVLAYLSPNYGANIDRLYKDLGLTHKEPSA